VSRLGGGWTAVNSTFMLSERGIGSMSFIFHFGYSCTYAGDHGETCWDKFFFFLLIVIGVTTVLCLKLIHEVILRSACLAHLRNQSILQDKISGHPYTKNFIWSELVFNKSR
jgi:hypothetical protein